jgi:cytochrome c553
MTFIRNSVAVVWVCAGLSMAPLAQAGDVSAGKVRAQAACASCHGVDGISANARWPNLAGQNDLYLIKQLNAFRDGSRKDAYMTPMARPLTDQDVRNLAAHYASLPRP